MKISLEYILGFLLGLCTVAALAGVIIWISRRKRGSAEYDERQTIARLRAYRTAFWMLAAYLCLSGLFTVATGLEWADAMTGSFIGICIAVTVFACISISDDAYFAINEKPRFYLVLFAVVILANAAVTVKNLADGVFLVTDGRLNYHCMNLVVIVTFLAISVALAIKSAGRGKREE
jgi:hypothetical protein